jgi:hypothetical protein
MGWCTLYAANNLPTGKFQGFCPLLYRYAVKETGACRGSDVCAFFLPVFSFMHKNLYMFCTTLTTKYIADHCLENACVYEALDLDGIFLGLI